MTDTNFVTGLCNVERDRLTAAEICIDEILTIMDRHGVASMMHTELSKISASLHTMLTKADGVTARRARMIRIRKALTDAMPMSDEDLLDVPAPLSS